MWGSPVAPGSTAARNNYVSVRCPIMSQRSSGLTRLDIFSSLRPWRDSWGYTPRAAAVWGLAARARPTGTEAARGRCWRLALWAASSTCRYAQAGRLLQSSQVCHVKVLDKKGASLGSPQHLQTCTG